MPPPRFAEVRFATYQPSPAFRSQGAALTAMEQFATTVVRGESAERIRLPRRTPRHDGAPARYLDGGFGVGKTHLLAGLWHEVDAAGARAAYLSFGELTALIGFLGMAATVDAFRGYRLVCIDEFELDDVANTLMMVTFLRGAIAAGVRVATTSNTVPDRLGDGRFSAEDFRREIAAIAEHFEVLSVDGPDYRNRGSAVPVESSTDGALDRLVEAARGQVTLDEFDELLAHLRHIHPVQFPALVAGLDAVCIRGMHPIEQQGDALLFVQFVDELYDAELIVAASGCAVGELFPSTYRHGGYRKKYGRAESRFGALLADASDVELMPARGGVEARPDRAG